VTVVAALAVIAGVLAFSGPLGRISPSASVIVVSRNPLVGQPAPDFDLQTVDGQTVSLSSLRGRPVIINFWASSCLPCRDEFPLLVSAYQKYSPQGLEILGVIHDDGPDTASTFAKGYGATWPLVLDPDHAAWDAYRGAFLPVSYYVDRDGIIRTVSYGPPPSGFLDDEIREIL
jgi:cytochrome c biogenesis protein CcmG/thiol:disulfide interchange protein DsbE